MTIENCGTDFNFELYLKARDKTIAVVHSLASKIYPGMSESQSIELLNQELNLAGIEKFWHPTKFRINKNTTKSFRDISEEAVLLDDDIFFIDIGPVFFNHEADYGETFVVGSNQRLKFLQDKSKEIFHATKAEWNKNKLTGSELYEFASALARKSNLELNTKMYGHRLGDFPHALHYKGNLGTLDFSPAPGLWVLEIHLIDPSINRGAFFEDILL